MVHYVYSSPFRRAALELLGRAGKVVRIALVGERSRERMLVRDFDHLQVDPGAATTEGASRLARCDGIFCAFSDVPLIRGVGSGAIKAISVTGPPGSLTADAFEAIGDIASRLELELASHQSDPRDFGRDKEVMFLLARRADRSLEPWDALKLALLFEGHSLQRQAVALLRRYNEGIEAAYQLDEALIDQTYEVEPFVGGDYSQAKADAAAAGAASMKRRHEARRFSIHCDLLHRADGDERLRRLAKGLALPEQAEIVVRVPGPTVPDFLPHLSEDIAGSGLAIRIFQDPVASGVANPCAGGFLTATGVEAEVAVYCDGESEPGVAGWDYDLLRALSRTEGKVFALRTGEHKTRYYTAPEDAAIAPEPVPAVSRTWLEACGAWSVPGVSAGVFQALVAFYFGRIDWTNKHRLLRLYPVVTVPMVTTRSGETADAAAPRRRVRHSGLPRGAEEKAIEAALRMHALEWCSREGLSEPDFVYDPQQRRLALWQRGGAHVVRCWSATPDRARLPL